MTNPVLNATASFGPSQLLERHATPADLLVRFRMPGSGARRPVNLALAIDVSGSMAGSPLKHAIRAAQAVVDGLEPQDLLSVVLYDDSVSTLIAPTAVTDRAALKDRIGSIRAGGLTNLSGGWLKAIEHVQAGASADRVSRVLVLTDGQANVGITQDDVLIKTAGQKAEAGVTTTTLGFGSSFNEDLLMGMARAAGGNFYFIQSTDDARDVFSFELQTMKAVVAQNLTVTLTPAAGVTVADILSLHRPGPSPLTLDLGDVYEDEDKLLGLRLNLPERAAGTHGLLTLAYSADTVQDGAITRVEGTLPVQAAFGPLDASVSSDAEVTLDLARLQIARAKEDAVSLADQGQHAQGEALLRGLVAELTRAGLHEHFEIAEEIEQLEHYAQRIAAQTLVGDSRKELMDQAFQGRARTRADMSGRGVTVDTAVLALPVVAEPGAGAELQCVREGGKLRVRVVSAGFDASLNVQFPRALRAEGAQYIADGLEPSADGSFYRVTGEIRRLVRAGESDPLQNLSVGGRGGARPHSRPGVTKAARTAADLDTTDSSAGGILVQCVKEGSKLRARVVQDGYEPDWNMRFPRSIREEGTLYVVDEVNTAPDGKSYIASGEIRRLVQPV
ncbi:vWA domain-containing protein [Deinococcus sp. RM]|uniref:vWA domain-containing protein n=1 Tax=Deinococcus sp. RM TaxID=2316359 RepID=UPI000E6A15ED|nr:VWA domain-containing protein [Deinococcus sp. RM]RIY15814.1 VWA domain-containing protein [Deinococcus sp. RM]